MGPFEYFEPATVEEAVSLLKKYGEGAKILAGGTDLVVMMREREIKPRYVINLGRIAGLNYVHLDGDKGLRIGALTTIAGLERAPELKSSYRIISQAAAQLATIAIRNMATIGGNLCNAAPSADMAPPLLALKGAVKLTGTAGERIVPLEEFFIGPGVTTLKPNELMIEIQVPAVPAHTGGMYLKHGVKGAAGLAVVGVAAVVTLDIRDSVFEEVDIALGAVAPTPIRAKRAEALLKGQKISDGLIEEAARVTSDESSPIDDVRGSAEYRREMVRVRTWEAIRGALKLAKSV